jgi:hypothetical protein
METNIKECTKCHIIKDIPKNKRWCKSCKNEYERNRKANKTEEHKEERKKSRKKYYEKKLEIQGKSIIIDETKSKVCTKCCKNKTLDNFYLHKSKGTIRAQCKECSSKERKKKLL